MIFRIFHHYTEDFTNPHHRCLGPRALEDASRGRDTSRRLARAAQDAGGCRGSIGEQIWKKVEIFDFLTIFKIFLIFCLPGSLRSALTLDIQVNMYGVPRPSGRPVGSPGPTDGCLFQYSWYIALTYFLERWNRLKRSEIRGDIVKTKKELILIVVRVFGCPGRTN